MKGHYVNSLSDIREASQGVVQVGIAMTGQCQLEESGIPGTPYLIRAE